jgi:glutaminyl-tRNA synthetase
MSSPPVPTAPPEGHTSNFLRHIIDADLRDGTYKSRSWSGSPGDARVQAGAPADPAAIRTRFPPEPNGYLHIGHAKSICLNFGLARDYGGVCHMRFDDTNPEKEEQEYVDSILDAVKWLGFGWDAHQRSHLYYASDYFDFMYEAAEHLISAGHAYVDSQSAEEMRVNRGTLTEAGKNSPWRDRPAEDSLRLFREMRDGRHAEGSLVLRARVDMASPNINLRDPAIYRIRKATHHRTGDKWSVYPMYTFAHPIEDALECITHSICTLEFEDQRPFYDWLLLRLAEGGLLAKPLPHQYEFARLNLTYVITSKRKLKQLVDEQIVNGWDDPRMPTIVGLRRRGYTPESIQLFCERIGVSKADSWIDYATLEIALRDDLDAKAGRAMAVLDPLRLKLTNWAEVFGEASHAEPCSAPVHPHHPERGQRRFSLGSEAWVERDDFMEVPAKGYHRLYPGNKTRLKYGYVIECTGCEKDVDGRIKAVLARVVPDTKSGTPGADSVKVKGVITWVGVADALSAEVRLYDRLFTDPHPDAGGKDIKASLNPDSLRVIQAFLEPSLASAAADEKFQFERHGYFVADRRDHTSGQPVFNKSTGLKDTWSK